MKITGSDFNSPKTIRDFFTFYEKLQQQEPLFYLDDFYGMGGVWVAFHHDDVVAILKDPRFIKDMRKFSPLHEKKPGSNGQNPGVSKMMEWVSNMPNMLSVDPPDHTRLRRLASKAFTPRMIESLRPRIQQISDELLDTVQEDGKMDLIANFAYPLPIIVISEMLGISAADRDKFRYWTQKIMNATDPSQWDDVTTILDEFIYYIESLLTEKRKHPSNDLMSALVQAQEQEDQLSEKELLSTIWLLIIAGHETTANLIGNGMLALLQHPEQMQLLRENPTLLPSAIEELLRYAGPIIYSSRFAAEDILMHGKLITKGELVLISLAAANIDPQKFSNPKKLDITREENEHLAFGKGIHHCLGAPLARLEGEIAFGTLLQRLPNLSLAIDPEHLIYSPSKLRSLVSLPVIF